MHVSGVARGGQGAMCPSFNPEKNEDDRERSSNNWLPDSITGYLVKRVRKYSGFQDA